MSSRKKYMAGISIALAVTALGTAALTGGCGSSQPVVKDVDHIATSTSQPEQLFTFFTGTLGLPAAWPFVQYPGFATGGVYLGNVNMETLLLEGVSAPGSPAFFFGIVFEPYPLTKSIPLFKANGADPQKPTVQTREENGKQVPVWTNVTLKALCTKDYIVYLCAYTPAAKAHLVSVTSASKPPLGPLGVTSVKEAVITSTDPEATISTWKKAMVPVSTSSDGTMTFQSGPAIRIIKGSTDMIATLIIEVASLDTAKTFLQKNGLLGKSTGSELTIEPSKVQGLDIQLVQQAGK